MTQSGPRRRPESGGYARGEERRLQIIHAALRRFGEDGYNGTSTRQIAMDAGVNTPALQYYFNGKEGLYRACGEYIVERFRAAMQAMYARAAAVPDGDRDAAVAVLCDMLDAIADFLFEPTTEDGLARFLARLHNRDGVGPIDDALGDRVEDELHAHCTRLVGVATRMPAEAEVTKLRATAITGQLSAFHGEKEGPLRRLGWPDFRGPRLVMLKAVIRAQTMAALA